MDPDDCTLYSNRSGALRKYRRVEVDARRVIEIKEDWVRSHTHLGAA